MKRHFLTRIVLPALLLYPLFADASGSDLTPVSLDGYVKTYVASLTPHVDTSLDSAATEPIANVNKISQVRKAKREILESLVRQEDNTLELEEYSDSQLQDFINRINMSKRLYDQGYYVDWKRYSYPTMKDYVRRFQKTHENTIPVVNLDDRANYRATYAPKLYHLNQYLQKEEPKPQTTRR